MNDPDPSSLSTKPFDQQLKAISDNGWFIRYISHPSKQLQLAAVYQDPWCITLLHNPSIEVQLAAVKLDPFVLECIDFPADEVLEFVESQKLDA